MRSFVAIISLFLFCVCIESEIAVAEDRAVEGPSIEIMERTINLGIIDTDSSEIVGNIHFFNKGNETLRISKVHGPCACFAGYEGDTVVAAQEGGVVEVKFTKSKIKSGDVTRMVRVMSNDPENSSVEVRFKFHIKRDAMEEELRLLHEELSRVQKDVRVIRADMKKILKEMKIDPQAKKKKTPDTTIYDIPIGSSPVLGPDDATVTIVEFSDFQCVYCSRETPKIKQIARLYPKDVKVVFKHYPLKFHKEAKPAHAASVLAYKHSGSEGFWKMHDMIFASPKDLSVSRLRKYAGSLDMDLSAFDRTLGNQTTINKMLQDDYALARKCKVTGTPTILINGLKMTGRTIADYKKRIDSILAKAK